MLITPNPSAIFPELLQQQGQLRVIYQIEDTLFLSSVQGEVVVSFPCSVGAFPKCDGSWCIYRNQGVSVTVFPENAAPQLWSALLSPWQRQGLNLYDAFFSSGPPRRVNFATQVVFERLGVASLTTWPADYSLPAYVPPTYGQGVPT